MRRYRGFTYVTLLAIVSTTAIMAGVAATVTSTYVQRDLEQELIFRGLQYSQAIESYYQAGSPRAYPRSLDDLLKDPRFIHKVHLRKPYQDPFLREGEGWHTLHNERGEIIGVASQSNKKPIKTANFPHGVTITGGGTSYKEWQFIYVPQAAVTAPLGAGSGLPDER